VHALEGMELIGMEQKILSDICKGNWNRDQEEPIAKTARELRCSANGTVCSSEWSNIDDLLWFWGKIYVLQSSDLRRQIVALCHDTHIAGHPGCWKTLELVSRNYWWPQMSRYIGQYISTYDLPLDETLAILSSWRASTTLRSRRTVGYAQYQFHGRTPGVFQTRRHHDCRRFCFQESTLRSNAHNGHSRRSSQTLSSPRLEALRPPETCYLWPRTPICSFIH